MLSSVERKIDQYITDLKEKDINAISSKLPSGKRLRARLMLEIAGDSLKVIKAAAIVEMIHAASLLHDDVIDNATTRRGKSSINSIYGDKSAIMIGDILYSKAFCELLDLHKPVAKAISNAVVQLSIGERKDVYLSESFNVDIDTYKEMIYQKTAVLIEAASEAAAIIANKNIEIFKIYGRNLGLAFQMIDDILDIISDEKSLGKPALSDFKEGKTTLPYIYLYNELNSSEQKILKSFHKKLLSSNEQNWILDRFKKYNIIEKSKQEALLLVEEAIRLMRDNREEGLEKIALKMIDRSF